MPDGTGHLTRDEAFLLVGLLVADADGRRLPIEIETLFNALEGRNAKVGEASRRLVQALAAQVRRRGLPSLIAEVSRGLPLPDDRRWAFGLAVEVAYADHFLHPKEAEQIVDFGDVLNLPDDDTDRLGRVAQALRLAQRPLSDAS